LEPYSLTGRPARKYSNAIGFEPVMAGPVGGLLLP
jgi:hypothetical protein